MKSTPLLEAHRKEKARLVPFAGWEMPIEYSGILEEHRAVREDKGLFDLSHMGEIEFTRDQETFSFLQSLITNDLASLEEGQALYTVMCKEDGGILDDMVIYNLPEKFLVVVNASNTAKILGWLQERKPPNSRIAFTDRTDETALLAVQGPKAEEFLQQMTQSNLSGIRYYHASKGEVAGVPSLISRTGYTGEDGFELYVEAGRAGELWGVLRERKIQPIGLGARDTLRLEACYLLYGNDLDESISPLEAGLSWVVKLAKEDFVGKSSLLRQKESGLRKRLTGMMMQDRTVPRKGYRLSAGSGKSGVVASGTFSPTLGKGIALGYVEAISNPLKEGEEIRVEIRGEPHPAVVARRPFVKGSVKSGS